MNTNKRILIIEDLPFWALLLKHKLKKMGIEGEWVENGLLAVKKIAHGKVVYDGIITDVQMPVMNGLEATKKIRELGYTHPIIGFSSLGREEDVAKGLEEGMDAYFIKSVDLADLKQMLIKNNIIEEHKAEKR